MAAPKYLRYNNVSFIIHCHITEAQLDSVIVSFTFGVNSTWYYFSSSNSSNNFIPGPKLVEELNVMVIRQLSETGRATQFEFVIFVQGTPLSLQTFLAS